MVHAVTKMRWRRKFDVPRVSCLAMAAVLAAARSAECCTICIGFPEESDADMLLESECVVFARQNPDHPFEFAAVEVLAGKCGADPIDLFVDSVTRRRLTADPRRVVVLVHTRDGNWKSLGVASVEYEQMVRQFVRLMPRWRGPNGHEQRINFFRPLFGHHDPQIRELAYLEMGRAPYATIRQLGRGCSRKDFSPMLAKREYLEWRSLAILLLAQSDDVQDRKYVLNSFHTARRAGLTTNLAAWAAAAIEIDRQAIVRTIEEEYFRAGQRTMHELKSVLQALSLHGAEDPQLRDQIVAAYDVLLEQHPELAPLVAVDLHAWHRADLKKPLSDLLANHGGFDVVDRRTIQRYLESTPSAREASFVHD